jgi:DNA-binding transcriptional MerR regulator
MTFLEGRGYIGIELYLYRRCIYMTEGEIILTGSQAQEQLELKIGAFKKYQTILEKAGYKIKRNDKNHRYYTSHDIMTFKQLIEYSQYEGMTLEKAANLIVERSNSLVPYEDMTEEKQPINLTEHLIQVNNEKQDERMQQLIHEMENRILLQMEIDKQEILNKMDQRSKQTDTVLIEWREQQRLEQQEQEQALLESAAVKQKKWWEFWK